MNNTADKQSELAIKLFELQILYHDRAIKNLQKQIQILTEERKDLLENRLHYTSEFALMDEEKIQKTIDGLEMIMGFHDEEILGDTNEEL